jgi:transcriptional regulator of acetoin/glycerol metabolism
VLAAPRLDWSSRARLESAWRRFLSGGGTDGVRPEIARSWERARDVHGVDPQLPRPPVLSAEELAVRRERDEAQDVAQPVLAAYAEPVARRGHLLVYLDAEGWVLTVGGEPRLVERAAELNLSPGGCWAEAVAGTNGAGTALAERRPLEVFACEHWLEAAHAWSGAGAPVLAEGGAPRGVVLIAGPWELHDPQAAVAAAAIADLVAARLRAIRSVRDEVVRHALRAARAAGEALLAVDARGNLVAATDGARRALAADGALPPELAAQLAQALGGAEGSEDEVGLEWPGQGEERRRASCAVIRHGARRIGAIVRIPTAAAAPARPARGGARGRPGPTTRYGFQDILGGSARLRTAVELARVAARNDLPVVLLGESGTGKELFAHGIHAASARADGPFVTVNCGAIPAPLVEAELFGYEPGSFTGGQREGRAGKLEEADGGTLFLDEVSELSPQAQTALLRALQESEIVRVGGVVPRHVDVRIVAATNRDLAGDVAAGRFRQDLFFRINVLGVPIPALRERIEDVRPLAAAFLAEAEGKIGRSGLSLSEEALAALSQHPWPGNVRELRNVVLRAAAVAAAPRIEGTDLTLVRFGGPAAPAAAAGAAPALEGAESQRNEVVAALDRCGWNIARTATSLGVSRMTLYRWLRRYDITR